MVKILQSFFYPVPSNLISSNIDQVFIADDNSISCQAVFHQIQASWAKQCFTFLIEIRFLTNQFCGQVHCQWKSNVSIFNSLPLLMAGSSAEIIFYPLIETTYLTNRFVQILRTSVLSMTIIFITLNFIFKVC